MTACLGMGLERFRRRFQQGRVTIPVLLVLLAATPLRAQLFDNLQGLGERLDVGDPDVTSLWKKGREGPKGLAVADFNGDSLSDIAASNLDGTVTVYLSLGEAGFAEPRHLQTGAETLREVLARDLDADGTVDLVAASHTDAKVFVFEGSGNGGFSEARPVETWQYARNLTVGEFLGDGRRDLIVGGPGEGIVQFRRQDGGEYSRLRQLPELSTRDRFTRPVFTLRAVRFPGGERDSLVATNAYVNEVFIYEADDDGVLRSSASVETIGDIYFMDIGEITTPAGSGRLDLVTAHRDSGLVQVRAGTDDPERFEQDIAQEIAVPGGPRSVSIRDLDDDGWNDVVVVLRNLDSTVTYRNEAGVLVPSAETVVGRSPRQSEAGDFDGDGIDDTAIINRVSSDVSVLTTFPGTTRFAALDQIYATDGEPVAIDIIDFNNDGRDDIVQLHRSSGEFSVRFSQEGGSLADPVYMELGEQPSGRRIADVNGDGKLDYVSANLGRSGSSDGSVTVRLGDGTGGFSEARHFAPPPSVAGGMFDLEVGDLDGDGDVDLAVGYFDCRIAFFEGQNDGTFAYRSVHEFILEPRALALADFDQDGDLDLAGASFTGTVVVVENPGNLLEVPTLSREFHEPPSEGKFGTRSMLVEDFNKDGDPDLLLGSGRGLLRLLGTEGMGFTFNATGIPSLNLSVSSLVFEDLDGDGLEDLIVACNVLSCITVLTREAEGSPFLPALSLDVPSARVLASGDLDGDGETDLVGSGEVLWTALSSRRAELQPTERFEPTREIAPRVSINELLAINNELPVSQDAGKKVDWIELYSSLPQRQSLAGWKLELETVEGDVEVKQVFEFPEDATLEGENHLLVFFSRTLRTPYHTGFKLPGSGGTVRLVDDAGQIVDEVSYPEQRDNVSFARYADGLRSFVFNNFPSPAEANVDNGPVGPQVDVRALTPALEDGGGKLVRPFRPNEPLRFFVEASDDVGVVAVSVVYQRLDIENAPLKRVILYDDGAHADGGLLDGLFAGDLQSGLPAGAEIRFRVEAVDLNDELTVEPGQIAPGQADDEGFFALSLGEASGSSARIVEVVPRNDTGLEDAFGGTPDWVAIRNCSGVALQLGDYYLAKRFPDYTDWYAFPEGTELAPGEEFVVHCDDNVDQGPTHAPFTLKIGGDELYLLRGTERGGFQVADVVTYPEVEPDTAWARESCEGEFRAAEPSRPNGGGEVAAHGDVDRNGNLEITDAIVLLRHLFLGAPAPCRAAGEVNGDRILDLSDAIALLHYLFLGGEPPPDGSVNCSGER